MTSRIERLDQFFPLLQGAFPYLEEGVNYSKHSLHLMSNLKYAAMLKKALEYLKVSYVIDATAGIGGHTLSLSEKFPVLAYEKDLETIRMLRNNLALYKRKVTTVHSEFVDSDDICVITQDPDAKAKTAVLIDPEWIEEYTSDYSSTQYVLSDLTFGSKLLDDLIDELRAVYQCVLVHVPKEYIFRGKHQVLKADTWAKHKVAIFAKYPIRMIVEEDTPKPIVVQLPECPTLSSYHNIGHTLELSSARKISLRGEFLSELYYLRKKNVTTVLFGEPRVYDSLLRSLLPHHFQKISDPYMVDANLVVLARSKPACLFFKYVPREILLLEETVGTVTQIIPYHTKVHTVWESILHPLDQKRMNWLVSLCPQHDYKLEAMYTNGDREVSKKLDSLFQESYAKHIPAFQPIPEKVQRPKPHLPIEPVSLAVRLYHPDLSKAVILCKILERMTGQVSVYLYNPTSYLPEVVEKFPNAMFYLYKTNMKSFSSRVRVMPGNITRIERTKTIFFADTYEYDLVTRMGFSISILPFSNSPPFLQGTLLPSPYGKIFMAVTPKSLFETEEKMGHYEYMAEFEDRSLDWDAVEAGAWFPVEELEVERIQKQEALDQAVTVTPCYNHNCTQCAARIVPAFHLFE